MQLNCHAVLHVFGSGGIQLEWSMAGCVSETTSRFVQLMENMSEENRVIVPYKTCRSCLISSISSGGTQDDSWQKLLVSLSPACLFFLGRGKPWKHPGVCSIGYSRIIRDSSSLTEFKKSLKPHLLNTAFNLWPPPLYYYSACQFSAVPVYPLSSTHFTATPPPPHTHTMPLSLVYFRNIVTSL